MALDTTAAQTANNSLQAIPFSVLIGGPLQAAVEAQAMAAQSTAQYIETVGLDSNGSPIQVSFQFIQNGQTMMLVVPLLSIVPIPLIQINDMTIDFTANLSATASSVDATASSSSTNVGGGASASYGFGAFNASANFYANYSNQSNSTSSDASQYDVQYLMDIHVQAGPADLPAGLLTVLNILAGATSATQTLLVSAAPDSASNQLDVAVSDPNSANTTSGVQVTASIPQSLQSVFQIVGTGTQGTPGSSATVTLSSTTTSADFTLSLVTNATAQSSCPLVIAVTASPSGSPAPMPITYSMPFTSS
jgi:hypothetical protein